MANFTSASASSRRRFGGLEPEERKRQRRQRLLQAGLETFGTRGFHAVGVRDICAQAELTERYFYESFTNREALFLAVYELAVERMRTSIAHALERAPVGDGKNLARTGLRAMLEQYRADRRIARILLIEVLSTSVGETSMAAGETFADLIEQLTRGLYPDLDKYELNVRLLAQGLYGSTIYIAMRWALGGFREPLEQVLDHCALFYESLKTEIKRRTREPQPDKKPKRKTRTKS